MNARPSKTSTRHLAAYGGTVAGYFNGVLRTPVLRDAHFLVSTVNLT
jgi:hypothetical protein